MTVLGELHGPWEVEQAFVDRLRAWTPTYVAELERQTEREVGRIPPLRSVVTASEFDKWPENQLPAAVVISPGTLNEPVKDAEGYYRAEYSVAVGVVVATREEKGSRLLAQLYGAAVRGALLQRRSLGGAVAVTDWMGESFDDLPVEERRTMFAGINLFGADLERIVSWKHGPPPSWEPGEPPIPADPPDDPTEPFPDPPTVKDVTFEVDDFPPDES